MDFAPGVALPTQTHATETPDIMIRVVTLTCIGIVIILVTLRDVVHELFHPEDSGSLSRWVMRVIWRVMRLVGTRYRSAVFHAGPFILIGVAFTWTALLLVGWAFIYWPRLPSGFNVSPGLPADAAEGFLTALYVSLASMTTLSASDLTPKGHVVRYMVTFESFVGPVLFTAWISWVLSIYPVLADRRSFALQVGLLRRANDSPEQAVAEEPPEAVVEVLRTLTEQLLHVTTQLRQSRVTYYFQNDTPDATLTRELPWALALARAASARESPRAIHHHGRMLEMAIEELVGELGEGFLGLKDESPERVLQALARDHLLEDVQPGARASRAS